MSKGLSTAQRVARVLNGQSQWTCDGTRCVTWDDPRRCGHNYKTVANEHTNWYCTLRKGHRGDHIGCGRDQAGRPELSRKDPHKRQAFHAKRTWPRERKRKAP